MPHDGPGTTTLISMTSRTRLVVLLVSAPVIAFVVIGGFLGRAVAREDSYGHLRIFEDVVSLIIDNYVEAVDIDRVMEGAMRGLSDGLDPDSAYLTVDQVREFESGGRPPEGRVGLQLTRQYYLQVIAARDGSPAADAGLRPGDYIRNIEGQPTRAMSVFEGTRLLRGASGSTVELTILRGNSTEPTELKLVREPIGGAAEISGRIVSPGVGYVRIAAFGPDVAAQITATVAELAREGARQLVIDVRAAAEGSLDTGLDAARLFVSSGALAVREEQAGARETFQAGGGDGTLRQPLVLLVDGGTAGAAELFAIGLTANDRAEAIGRRTSGRTALQKLVNLPNGSGLWLSWAQFLTPSGTPIHGQGLEPDVVVDEPVVPLGTTPPDEDPVLDTALDLLATNR